MTRIYECGNHILIHAGFSDPAEHAHMATQIILVEEGNLEVILDGRSYGCRGIAIPSGTAHKIGTCGKPVLVFLYDCTTALARSIERIRVLDDDACQKIWDAYLTFRKGGSYAPVASAVTACFDISDSGTEITDDRIRSALSYIRSGCKEPVSCGAVAAQVHLSESRFSHLFRQQVGMTFSTYVIYQRLMGVYTDLLQGKSITDAALDAGFYSASHFADVNRRVFGLSAGRITDEIQFQKIP